MRRVEYRELHCKSVLNRVRGPMPFRWSINPYRGCAHGCHYCFARGTHTYLDLDAGADFAGIVFVKVNAPHVLRAELRRSSWHREEVNIGSATDPYQPAEGRFRITRQLLEVLYDHHVPVSIVTKGTLIVRDLDVLQALSTRAGCTVCISVPTVDEALWRRLEPGTAPPAQRLRILRRLVEAGVHAGVLAAPILPGLSDATEQLEATVRAAHAHGARFLWADLLHLGPLMRDHYLRFLSLEYPELLPLYGRLYPGTYAPTGVRASLKERVTELKACCGLVHQPRPEPPAHLPRQLELIPASALCAESTVVSTLLPGDGRPGARYGRSRRLLRLVAPIRAMPMGFYAEHP